MYIGETSRALKVRITEHRSAIKGNDVTSPASRHFNDKHKGASIFFIGIESVKTNGRGGNRNTIREKERDFLDLLLEEFVSLRVEQGVNGKEVFVGKFH